MLFRYGVVVLFGLSALEEVAFLSNLRQMVSEPLDEYESENVELVLDPETSEGYKLEHVSLQSFSLERLQLVANVLAKSVVLDYYEGSIAHAFDRIEPLAADLQRVGRGGRRARELLQHMGHTLLVQGKMVGRVEMSEKPDLLWEHPELERLYARLEDEYEVRERHVALERKLDLISRTAETLLGLLQNRRSLRVEWYIVILILAEIVLYLYELWH